MCSARKRSSYEADSSDDDFDYSLQKRLRAVCRKKDVRSNKKRQREKPANLKHPRNNQISVSSKSNSFRSNGSISNSVIESSASGTLDCLALMESNDDSIVSDNNVSSSHIIDDVLSDCDDVPCPVEPQALTTTSQSPTQRPIEVPSPKKQSSLLEYFKVERNGVILTKEETTARTTSSTSSNSTNFKMYRSGSSQMVFTKPNKPKNSTSFYSKTNRNCPFYKKIPNTSITVDAFQYGNIPGCNAYFLTHFHSDHYNGLTKHFRNPIYCSSVTGNLVSKKLGVGSEYIHKLPLNDPTTVERVTVTLLDANHCPGSVMFLFVLDNSKVYLHTGDFRACQGMERIPILNKIHIDQLYLDTTYCNPRYNFPSQDEVISFVAQKAREAVDINPKTLIVCGTYTIGKEKIFLAIAELLGSKVFVSKEKKITLDCLESKEISDILSTEESNSRIHVLPMMKITLKGMNEYLKKYSHRFNSVLGFKPTGWTYSESICSLSTIKPQISGQVTIYGEPFVDSWSNGDLFAVPINVSAANNLVHTKKSLILLLGVPYSEHSSFSELKRFVKLIRPTKIIPTVFGGAGQSISDMQAIFKEWLRH